LLSKFITVWNDYVYVAALTRDQSLQTVQVALVNQVFESTGISWSLLSAFITVATFPILGAAGAVASFALTRAGRKVVALEAGPPRTGREYAMDELQCSRIRNTWGATRFTAEVPTWRPNAMQPTQPLRPFQKVANGIGGSSNVYGAVSWRFHPDDFRIRSNTIARDGPSVPLIDGHRPKQLVRWTVMVGVLERIEDPTSPRPHAVEPSSYHDQGKGDPALRQQPGRNTEGSWRFDAASV
jgi:choline dehydrogenase-like flavoprotein